MITSCSSPDHHLRKLWVLRLGLLRRPSVLTDNTTTTIFHHYYYFHHHYYYYYNSVFYNINMALCCAMSWPHYTILFSTRFQNSNLIRHYIALCTYSTILHPLYNTFDIPLKTFNALYNYIIYNLECTIELLKKHQHVFYLLPWFLPLRYDLKQYQYTI